MAQQHSIEPTPDMPRFAASLSQDAPIAATFFPKIEEQLRDLGAPAERSSEARAEAARINAESRKIKEAFLKRHAVEMYDELTANGKQYRRVSELIYDAAERFPGVLPTREQIVEERSYGKQFAKEGREIDQGLFVAHILADERCGMHLVHAMLRPKNESLARIDEFREKAFLDLGRATVERVGSRGIVTLQNPQFLNAEDDAAVAALEVATDLLLLDDEVQVCVLRGARLEHPKYPGRHVFNAGINLTHLYYGQISFVEFILERELGLLNKMYRGLWVSDSYDEQFEDYQEKPWLGVVEAFAIGGGCQLACVMDRIIAEPGAYFSLPASKEGFMPGSANLRLPRLVGVYLSRHAIFFERAFQVDTPEGMMICDEVVEPKDMDQAIERNAQGLLKAGFTSAVSNRKGLRVGQEPLSVYRRYMATYARQQAMCFYDPALISNLEAGWQPQNRKM